MTAMTAAQIRYDRMEPSDIEIDMDDVIESAEDYDQDDRTSWLADHGLDLDDALIEAWAEAHRAAVVRDGTALRTLYRSQRYQPLPFGVL